MLQFTTGNILESTAECLVNTVNCEGYMGKGIAYQFKLRFPKNNSEYIKACKSGELRIGKIHYYCEDNKLILNFPTKNKWREKSKHEYIHQGLSELIDLIDSLSIKSIAIPPLGCGNGGLNWSDIRPVILEYLEPLSNSVDVFIYEPSTYFKARGVEAPKLNVSHVVLMKFKLKLKRFNKLRLQKTAYFMNIFLGKNYFKFYKHKYGPYAHSIDILTKDIKEFQDFYQIPTEEALKLVLNIVTSKATDQKMKDFGEPIEQATDFVNEISTDKQLELIATICSLLEPDKELTFNNIIKEIKAWSDEKANKFNEAEVLEALEFLMVKNIVQLNLMGLYNLVRP
ncbi:macro domain-containing protein [Trichocoleus desertorum AS-A10]|uniref:type II toxin-antitoxin system antitoxin DNA ADP-ribosyl glycohydrolase DarG n=1 Tax=Trichocoleus desertorum TaxID=1481672 RepID=UPI00329A74CB